MPVQTDQLDLFSDLSIKETAPPRARARSHAARPHPVPIDIARPPQLPAGTQWHEVQTAAQRIGFVLRRSRRKSIGLVVNDDGLQVTAPHSVSITQVDAAIKEKSRWVIEKLHALQVRQRQLAVANDQWKHEGHIPYFGTRIYLNLGHAHHGLAFEGKTFSPENGDILRLALPVDTEHHRIRETVQLWLQQNARLWFDQRLAHFVALSGHALKRWRLSSAATRWGSCSSDASIRLNWRLIHFDHAIIDYVIAHEVAHLRHMNHSNEFWDEVSRIYPGYKEARSALKPYSPATLPLI